MRILILTLGSRGDVQPYIALGVALRGRGHEVTLSTGRGFDAMIAAHGLRPAALSVDIQALLQTPEIQQALRSFSGKIKAWRHAKAMTLQQLDDMWAVVRDVRPDVIVYHPKAFIAPTLAQARGAVAIPSFLQPAYIPTGDFANPLFPVRSLGRIGNRTTGALLHRLIRFSLSSVQRSWFKRNPEFARGKALDLLDGYTPSGAPAPRLHAFSRHLVPRPSDWDMREAVTGYWFLDQATAWTPPPALERFLAAGPPVYIGFGSMPSEDSGRMTRLVVAALEQSGQRGVLGAGWGGLDRLAESDRVHVLDAAPHDWLFPRCAAVVHHGGAGTTHEALRWGRPSIICPVFGDQPFWARRVAAAGAGPAPLPQKRITSEALASAITAVLEPAFADRAQALGALIRNEDGVSLACSLIDEAGSGIDTDPSSPTVP